MNRDGILTRLRAAEAHISTIELQITYQRDFILSLKCAGCDTTSEVALQREMEVALAVQVCERDRLRAELATLDAVQDRGARVYLDAASA